MDTPAGPAIPTRIVPSARPAELTTRQVEREFRRLLERGATLRPAGAARDDPTCLLSWGYTPKHKVELFDTTFYVSNVRQNPDLRFFVGYVLQGEPDERSIIYPRLFYKDIALVWRSASHYIWSEDENWIGKGDLRTAVVDGREIEYSAEETTDLPLEIQTALEVLSRRVRRIPYDEEAIDLVLRRGPSDRLDPYRDFAEPRRRARANPANLINGGRSVATFERRNDPTSLEFVAGFEPDFAKGILERATSSSRLYGGELSRFRILSRNRKIQYLFFAGPRHVWIIPPQATTTELTTYGVRSVDVFVDEDLCVPGYEYHFIDDLADPPVLVSQIPEGFAGPPSELDPHRADASPWLDRLPVIQEFRSEVLGRSGSRRTG